MAIFIAVSSATRLCSGFLQGCGLGVLHFDEYCSSLPDMVSSAKARGLSRAALLPRYVYGARLLFRIMFFVLGAFTTCTGALLTHDLQLTAPGGPGQLQPCPAGGGQQQVFSFCMKGFPAHLALRDAHLRVNGSGHWVSGVRALGQQFAGMRLPSSTVIAPPGESPVACD